MSATCKKSMSEVYTIISTKTSSTGMWVTCTMYVSLLLHFVHFLGLILVLMFLLLSIALLFIIHLVVIVVIYCTERPPRKEHSTIQYCIVKR